MGARVPPPKPGDWKSIRQAIRKLAGLKLDIIQSDLQASIDSVETIASDAASLASDNVVAIASVETIASDALADASDNVIRIDSIETIASDNAVAIASIEAITSDNIVRLDSIETVASDAAVAASDNLLRIDSIETIASDNAIAIASVETIASDAAAAASDNVIRIDSVEVVASDAAVAASDNLIRIDSIETIASDNVVAIASVETIASDAKTWASDNTIRIDSIETLASDNAVAIASVETIASDAKTAASDNLIRIDSIEILVSDNTVRIDSIETVASDNAIAIASVETIASDALADASDNLIRIDSIEALASDNRVSIDSIETIASDNTVRIDSVEVVASDAAVLASDHIANDGTDHSFIDQDVTTSASPTFVDLTLSGMQLGSPTYPSIHDFLSTTVSVGQTSGGTVSDNGDGTVTVAAGTGYIKKTDSATGELVSFDWAENSSVSLTDNSVNYVCVKYNGGSPIVDSTDDFNAINFHTEFVVGLVYREGTSVKILQAGNRLPDAQIRFCTQKYLRGIEHISGGAIGEKATRYVTSTAGIFYIGDTRIDTPAFDSSTENFEHYYYRDGAGGWSDAAATGQIDNVYYDDGSGTLAELTTNRYGVHWVYISFEGKLSIVYGQGNYKYNEAVLAQPPSSIPDYLNTFAILAGKIVIQKNASSFSAIESAFVKVFVPEDTLDHNDLASLQGGTSGEYYHLTSAQYTDLTDSSDCTIHYHSADRDRANHIGTQLASTISDFDEAAQDAIGTALSDTNSIDFMYDDDNNKIKADVKISSSSTEITLAIDTDGLKANLNDVDLGASV